MMKKLYLLLFILQAMLLLIFHFPAMGQWANVPDSPLLLTDIAATQNKPVLVSDNDGGYYVFWLDSRDGIKAVYGQRLDADGNKLWGADGKLIADRDIAIWEVSAVLNDEGDVFVCWTGSPDTLFAQKINSDGDLLWADAVGVAGYDGGSIWGAYKLFAMLAEGSGFYVAYVLTGYGYDDMYINKVTGEGNLPWGFNGYLAYDAGGGSAGNIKLLSDGSGGAFISWTNGHGYLNRFDADGNFYWPAKLDVNECTNGTGGTYAAHPYFLLQSNSSGGLMATWSSYSDDIYASSISEDGEFLFDSTCASIEINEEIQEGIAFSKSDDAYYVSWVNSDYVTTTIQMQKFNEAGETQWPEPLFIENDGLYIPVVKSISTSEGDIAVFYQGNSEFLVQKVHADGTSEWPEPIPILNNLYQPFYYEYQLLATDDGNVIGVAETSTQRIVAFNLNFISGDTIEEDTTIIESIFDFENTFNIYPNPATDVINIAISNSNYTSVSTQVELLSADGRRIRSSALKQEIDITDLAPGIYFIKIGTGMRMFSKM
ncbi:MAG: T9SS type A sorting domain-containing protein [Chitinophagales bacterium]